ncbi:hypothetical protein BH18GEM1_BH18GEM1_15560 [soil metagenome]
MTDATPPLRRLAGGGVGRMGREGGSVRRRVRRSAPAASRRRAPHPTGRAHRDPARCRRPDPGRRHHRQRRRHRMGRPCRPSPVHPAADCAPRDVRQAPAWRGDTRGGGRATRSGRRRPVASRRPAGHARGGSPANPGRPLGSLDAVRPGRTLGRGQRAPGVQPDGVRVVVRLGPLRVAPARESRPRRLPGRRLRAPSARRRRRPFTAARSSSSSTAARRRRPSSSPRCSATTASRS